MIPLILGHEAILNEGAQEIVAAWIAMKVMVGEYFDSTKAAITLGERQFLMTHRRPPRPNWRIFVGTFTREKWAGQWAHCSMGIAVLDGGSHRPPEIPNTQTTTFVVGKLYAHVFSSEIIPLVTTCRLGQRAATKMTCIWPIERPTVRLPLEAMSDQDADETAVAIFNHLKTQFPYTG